MITFVIRGCLTLAMCAMIYREAGTFTALFAFFVYIFAELQTVRNKDQGELNKAIKSAIEKIGGGGKQ